VLLQAADGKLHLLPRIARCFAELIPARGKLSIHRPPVMTCRL
jgi:hypothetical protein